MHWLLERSADFHEAGVEPVAGLVLPTATFFPDHFEPSVQGVGNLMRRVLRHAGLSDLNVNAELYSPEGEPVGGGCSSGACGIPGQGRDQAMARVEQKDDGWQLNILTSEIAQPVVLTTAMVRGISHIFMREIGLFAELDRNEAESATDLCGVLLGFGVLLGNGAYIYKKG